MCTAGLFRLPLDNRRYLFGLKGMLGRHHEELSRRDIANLHTDIRQFPAMGPEIRFCHELERREAIHFHNIGFNSPPMASGGALYVFYARDNFVGWSWDSGDVMRNEAVFYPNWWLPTNSHLKKISLTEIREKISCQ